MHTLIFVVDSNFFIQAHRMHYPLDVALSFWLRVKQLAQDGIIVSVDKVRDELYQNSDELTTWCQANLPTNFFKNSSELIGEYTQIVNWAMSKKDHYLQKALDEFLAVNEADAWIIAYAMKHSCTITTHEKSQPAAKNKIKIPEPCNAFDISYLNTMEMFKKLKIQF